MVKSRHNNQQYINMEYWLVVVDQHGQVTQNRQQWSICALEARWMSLGSRYHWISDIGQHAENVDTLRELYI